MGKSTQEKIEALQQEILKKQREEKQLKKKYGEEQRKARNHRLCKRHGLFEKVLPESIDLTEEQFETFLKQHIANEHGRRFLVKITAQNSQDKAPTKTESTQQTAPATSSSGGDKQKEG